MSHKLKGAKLNIKILTGMAIVLGFIMATMNLYPSWSQHAGTLHDPLLYSALFCISSLFMISSFTSSCRDNEITKIWLVGSFRLGQCFRLVAYLFGGVITFSVNSTDVFVSTMHLICTGLAIFFGYVAVLTYPTTKQFKKLALIGTVIGVSGFLGAYLLNMYSIGWGEFIAAIPLAIFVNMVCTKKLK